MCTNPIPISYVSRKGVRKTVSAPCGKCCECVKSYQNAWMLRLSEESGNWKYTYFFTLTYADTRLDLREFDIKSNMHRQYVYDTIDCLYHSSPYCRKTADLGVNYLNPRDLLGLNSVKVPSVSVDHIQKWFKASRESFAREYGHRIEMKYFITSEYGPNTLRPHYHGLIFTDERLDTVKPHFFDRWREMYGFFDLHEVKGNKGLQGDTGAVSKYVSKYCCKPQFMSNPYEQAGVVDPVFRIMSKGIGKTYIHKLHNILSSSPVPRYTRKGEHIKGYDRTYLEWMTQQMKVYYHGFYYSLPRYWRNGVMPKYFALRDMWNAKKGIFEKKGQYLYDSESRIALALKALMDIQSAELYDAKFRSLRCEHPDWEDAEITHTLAVQDLKEISDREVSAKSQLAKFYFKATIQRDF